jgi:hypothetical protein
MSVISNRTLIYIEVTRSLEDMPVKSARTDKDILPYSVDMIAG